MPSPTDFPLQSQRHASIEPVIDSEADYEQVAVRVVALGNPPAGSDELAELHRLLDAIENWEHRT